MAESCVKIELEEKRAPTRNGETSSEVVVFTSEIPVTVKQEETETSCGMSGQESRNLPITSADYAEHSFVEVRALDDVLNIQISNVHGSLPFQNGSEEEIPFLGKQTENQMDKSLFSDKQLKSNFRFNNHGNTVSESQDLYRDGEFSKDTVTQKETYSKENELRSPISQTRFYNGIQLADIAEKEKEIYCHSRSSNEEVSSAENHPAGGSTTVFSAFQANNESLFPVYQMGNDKAMRANQFDTQNGTLETASSYQTGISKVPSSNEILNENVPLYHVGTVKEMAASQTRLIEGDPRYQVRNYQPEVSESSCGQIVNSGESLRFNQRQINDAGLNYNMNAIYKCCKCGCHSLAQSNPYYGLPPGLESQRPSVIMVPVNWNSVASGTSHMPLKGNTPYSLASKNWRNVSNIAGQQIESDSSDDDDDEREDRYFRWNIDGTTARFKLTREDWERIPINTFPSGGRLLSGDWTRIFLEKVKESNPWCSLRFKNNHVRSENSRKIHSAVFFRGGAECKRPECNVKVRFVIQKERGKYVDVSYVGNVCHSSRPGVSDSAIRRNKRVRRTSLS